MGNSKIWIPAFAGMTNHAMADCYLDLVIPNRDKRLNRINIIPPSRKKG
jgi:hypothetical protein